MINNQYQGIDFKAISDLISLDEKVLRELSKDMESKIIGSSEKQNKVLTEL